MGSSIYESEEIEINELVGFLAKWAPNKLESAAQTFPDLAKNGVFKPGVLCGAKGTKADAGAVLRITLPGLLYLLRGARDTAIDEQQKVIRKLRGMRQLRIVCQALTAITSGGTIVFVTRGTAPEATISSAAATISALVALAAEAKVGGWNAESMTNAAINLGRNIHEADWLAREIDALAAQMEIKAVQRRLFDLAELANKLARTLNEDVEQIKARV